MQQEHKLDFLLAIYIMAIVSAELMGSKLITIFGVATSVGILSLPMTFVINDIVSEVAEIRADATSDELEVIWITTSAASHELGCSWSYQVI